MRQRRRRRRAAGRVQRRIGGLQLVQLPGQSVHMMDVAQQVRPDAGRLAAEVQRRLRMRMRHMVHGVMLRRMRAAVMLDEVRRRLRRRGRVLGELMVLPLVAQDGERLLDDVRLDALRAHGHRFGHLAAGVRRLQAAVAL